MMNRPQISKLNIWSRYEKTILASISEALTNIRATEDLNNIRKMKEDDISRILYLSARKELFKTRLSFNCNIVLQAQNQPLEDCENKEAEQKKPDIQFFWSNPQVENYEDYELKYVVECKLIGKRPGRNLNKDYVIQGIKRFVSPEHAYADKLPSGAMIGYAQNMDVTTILTEINSVVQKNDLPILTVSQQIGYVIQLGHIIGRPSLYPTVFELNHIWVDFS